MRPCATVGAKDALRLLFLRETAAAFPQEVRKIIGMGFSLEQSCAAIGACKDADRVAELAVALLLDSLATGRTLPAPSAAFRGRVTDILRSGAYVSTESKTRQAEKIKQENKKLLRILACAARRGALPQSR